MKSFITAVVYPGSGYRLLNIGEALQEGDEVSFSGEHGQGWQEVLFLTGKCRIEDPRKSSVAFPYGYYRRKIGD